MFFVFIVQILTTNKTYNRRTSDGSTCYNNEGATMDDMKR